MPFKAVTIQIVVRTVSEVRASRATQTIDAEEHKTPQLDGHMPPSRPGLR